MVLPSLALEHQEFHTTRDKLPLPTIAFGIVAYIIFLQPSTQRKHLDITAVLIYGTLAIMSYTVHSMISSRDAREKVSNTHWGQRKVWEKIYVPTPYPVKSSFCTGVQFFCNNSIRMFNLSLDKNTRKQKAVGSKTKSRMTKYHKEYHKAQRIREYPKPVVCHMVH